MNDNFENSLQRVLVHEGGFSNHPSDPGGATMKGVTLQTFRRFFGNDKTVNDLKNITHEQLAKVYRTGYWDKCKCDQLPKGVDYAVFDVAVNSGPGRAAKFLQAAVGAAQDGAIGPTTLNLVAQNAPAAVINGVCDKRLAFLKGLKTFPTFGRGWTRRVSEVRQAALAMVDEADMDIPDDGHDAELAAASQNLEYPILKHGSNGEWVKKLQEALQVNPDGDFGSKTEAALKAFQEEHGLEADGIAGRNTYRALGLIE